MTSTLFLQILFASSIVTALITEAIKKIFTIKKSNLVAFIVSVVVGVGASVVYYILKGIDFSALNIVFILLEVLGSWLCAMLGYDKVKQAIEQIIDGKTDNNDNE